MGVRDRRALSQCLGKRKHPTKAKAERVRKRLHRLDDARMDVYKCGVCGAWHVGHTLGRLPRRTPSYKRDQNALSSIQVNLDR